MDPLSGAAIVGVGYLVIRREGAASPDKTQPEGVGPVVTSKQKLPPGNNGNLGQMIGNLVGGVVAGGFLDLTKGYDAPVTKSVAVPVLTGVAALGGAIVVVVAIGYGALAAGYVGVIVIAVLAICFVSFLAAANVEDVDRWNAYVFHKQIVVKMVAAGNFRGALLQAQEAAKAGIPGVGFYLTTESTVYYQDTLYYKTAFDATPKIPAPGGHGGLLNRGGLDKDYYYPSIVPYEYQTYFGFGGAHLMTRNDGTQINCIEFLQALYKVQADAHRELSKALGRAPTWKEWIDVADAIKSNDGRTLREWIDLHDAFGAYIQPNVPWIDVYLLQSPEFTFTPDPGGPTPVRHKRTYYVNTAVKNSTIASL